MSNRSRLRPALYCATAVAACAAIFAAGPAYGDADLHRLSVPAGSAAEVVAEIAEITGDSIIFPYEELSRIRSDGVRGVHTVQEALGVALGGTGLSVTSTEYGVLTIAAASAAEPAPAAPGRPPPPRPAEPKTLYRPALPSLQQAGDRMVVTGTRIIRKGLTTPVPVMTISNEELQHLSPSTLMNAVVQLPQFVNNSTPESALGWSGSAGQSFLNLRGIGSNRTLVLVDGRRLVSSTRRGTTDIGLLPEALLDRIEIVTGGASAAYGSDAVAGVVNFVLNKDFEGVGGHAQAGASSRDDYENYEVSLSAGYDLGDRTRLLLSGDIYANEGVADLKDREWHQSWALKYNPDARLPVFVYRPNVGSSEYTYGGLIPRGPLAGLHFLPNGQAAEYDYGVGTSLTTQIGGDGVDVAKERTVSPKTGRQNAFAYLSHEATPDLNLYLQALYGRTEVDFDKDPNIMSGLWEATIYAGNPYLPEDLQAQMAAEGIESFPFSRYSSKRDLGIGRVNLVNNTLSITAGLEAELQDWTVKAYYQYGHNSQDLHFTNAVRVDRVYQAMDAVTDPATGQPICRSTLSFPDNGCVPTSFFGDGAVSEAAKAWLLDENTQKQELDQHFAEVSAQSEPFSLPAGPVTSVIGASWRRETYNQFTAPYTIAQNTPIAEEAGYRGLPAFYSDGYPLLERAVTAPTSGEGDVWETFGEAVLPLIQGHPMFWSVDLHTALRFAHYEGSGGIWAWKAGLDWSLPNGLRLRGTVSRDVRAGSLAERFDRSSAGATARDPFLENSPTYSFGQLLSGNPEVDPESADTVTIGLVYQPEWLPGFGLTADYYDIRIADAITRLAPQTIIDSCFDGAEELCALIKREESGAINTVDATFLNLDEARTRGIDVEASYFRPVSVFGGRESIELRAIAALYDEASIKPYGARSDDYAGDTGPGPGLPDYALLLSGTYFRNGLSLNVTGRMISGGLYNHHYVEGVHIDDNTVDSMLTVNTRAAYRFDVPGGKLEAYFNVENLFDEAPPIASNGAGGFYGAQQSPSDFDRIGRRFTAGLAWRF